MSLTSFKRDLSRIKRKLGINFDKIDYERALERHNARFDILYAEKIAPVMDTLDKVIESLDESEIDPSYDYDSFLMIMTL